MVLQLSLIHIFPAQSGFLIVFNLSFLITIASAYEAQGFLETLNCHYLGDVYKRQVRTLLDAADVDLLLAAERRLFKGDVQRSEEHTSELQSRETISYAEAIVIKKDKLRTSRNPD